MPLPLVMLHLSRPVAAQRQASARPPSVFWHSQNPPLEDQSAGDLQQGEALIGSHREVGNCHACQRVDHLKAQWSPRLQGHSAFQDAHRETNECVAFGTADVPVAAICRAAHFRPTPARLACQRDLGH